MATVPDTRRGLGPGGRIRVDRGALLLSLPALICVGVLFVFPFLFGIDLSLRTGARAAGPWTLANYTQFFGDPDQVNTIWTTFRVALPVTIFSVALSVPLAYVMRHGVKYERLITSLLILPITLGTVMVAQAVLNYFGPVGWVNQVLQALDLVHEPVRFTHNWLGVEIALFLNGFPLVFVMILGYMSGIDPELERASRMLGAGPGQTFWRVLLPVTLPGLAIAFCLSFVANFGVFPSATLVGEPEGPTRVIAIAAYDAAFVQYNPPQGTAIALLMGVIELAVVGVVLWLRARTTRTATIRGGKGA
ncbi:MAG TPA: ABC transporter permease subunit [Chloroflexia bacterium]|nr:ABC transporter permease subunit [Chloroflexia bacterium]